MKIRAFHETDRAAVIQLWRDCRLTRPWNNPDADIDRKMAVQPEFFLVGELDRRIIASVMAGYDGHRGSVYYLAVSPQLQGRGFGRKLMHRVEELLRDMGCPKLNILVRTSNQRILPFYRSLGYSIDDVTSLGKRLIPDT